MNRQGRREFLADVGKGMLVAGVGSAVAFDLGLAPAHAAEAHDKLTFGTMEPMVALMQETPPDKLLPILVDKLRTGTELKTLVSAGALANARTFGGHDYDGYHSFMALNPAYQMSLEAAPEKRPLPVLKVLYRNASHIQNFGGCSHESLHPMEQAPAPAEKSTGESLRAAMRMPDRDLAERRLAAANAQSPEEAFNQVLYCVHDDFDVHRVVLAWRSWMTLDLTGRDQALTMLRQSVRYCVDSERSRLDKHRPTPGIRATLPKLLDQYALLSKPVGARKADDSWIEHLCQTVYASDRDRAADAVAAALAEGFCPEDIGEAIALAANRLVLRDPGRVRAEQGKPLGSVHGASVGVHASDSANAWRNIARVSNHRNTVASLIVGAYHTAGQGKLAGQDPYPWTAHLNSVKGKDAASLLKEAESAINAGNQALASAVVQRYGEMGFEPGPIFNLMMGFAMSEDGALHAEKYYRTVAEEFATTRPAFRWRQLVALARVTASEHGFPAPGYAQACRLLKV